MSHYSYKHTHTHTHTHARACVSMYIHILFLFFLYYIMYLHLTIIDHQNLRSLNSIRIKRQSTANRSVSSVGKSPMRDLIVQERRKKIAGILLLKKCLTTTSLSLFHSLYAFSRFVGYCLSWSFQNLDILKNPRISPKNHSKIKQLFLNRMLGTLITMVSPPRSGRAGMTKRHAQKIDYNWLISQLRFPLGK